VATALLNCTLIVPHGPCNAAPPGVEVKTWFTLSDCCFPPMK
jgi:hypothetical protein